MDTQLVGATCERRKRDACLSVGSAQHPVTRYGFFPMRVIDHLPWAVVDVGSYGQVDAAAVIRHSPIEQGDVAFFDGVGGKLGLQ